MKIAALGMALALLAPSAAWADWTHAPSGISLPDEIGDMRHGAERDLSNGEKLDVSVQYGTDPEPVTLYVYRASHPNPALWFERTRIAMLDNVGTFEDAAPRSFALGGPAPNGLRAEFAPTGKAWKATSVALMQSGEWLIKARVTSTTLDRAGVAARMDRLLAAVRFAKPVAAPLPLRTPAACSVSTPPKGSPRSGEKIRAAGTVMGIVAMADARGMASGLSGKPEEWCRDDPADPAMRKMASVYRRLDGKGWTALLGDAGMSAAALDLADTGTKGAALYFTRTGPTMLIQTFDAPPSLDQALGAVTPVLRGEAQPLSTIGTEAAKR